MIEMKKIVKKQEIQNKEREIAKFEEETKKLVSQKFYKQICIFRKKASENILIKKL